MTFKKLPMLKVVSFIDNGILISKNYRSKFVVKIVQGFGTLQNSTVLRGT